MTVDTKDTFAVTIAMTRQMDTKSSEPILDKDLMTRLGIESPHHITQTPIASIWRVTRADGNYAALKCYFQDDLQDEAPGFDLLATQNGIGAAKVYTRSNAAILMEWLDGPLLGDLTRAGKDEKASQMLLETALTLHHAPVKNIPSLDPLPRRFRALLNAKFTADCPDGIRTDVRKTCKLAEDLLADQQDIRPLHGDLHHDNIKAGDRGYLAFDAKGVLGERTFELANAFQNPLGSEALARLPKTIQRRAALWSAGLNVSKTRLLSWAAAFSGLSLAWHNKSTFGPESADQMRFISTILKLVSFTASDHA